MRVAAELPCHGPGGYPSAVDNGADSTAARRGSILDRVGRNLAGRSPIVDGIAIGAILAVVLSYLNGFPLCLAYPISVGLVVAGNPDLWLAAALAIAVYWNPAAAFVLPKPSVFSFALIGWRRREWWAIAAMIAW